MINLIGRLFFSKLPLDQQRVRAVVLVWSLTGALLVSGLVVTFILAQNARH